MEEQWDRDAPTSGPVAINLTRGDRMTDRTARFRVDIRKGDEFEPCLHDDVVGFYHDPVAAKAAARAALEATTDTDTEWWTVILEHGRWTNDPIDDTEYGRVDHWTWEHEDDHSAFMCRDDADQIVVNEAIEGPLA
jgi:hypothetical protein